MPLKPLDLLVALELTRNDSAERSYAQIAEAVGLSVSETNAAARRAVQARLLSRGGSRADKPRPNLGALLAFLEHGVRHAFFAAPGRLVIGVRTAHSAPPLRDQIAAADELPLVWPDAEGSVLGRAIEPLHPSAPRSATNNPRLYELLTLVDALRVGGVRERKLAMRELERRLHPPSDHGDEPRNA
jgi:hypothetical protein